MAQRTSVAAVKALMAPGIDYDLTRAPDLQPFIDTATVIVDRVATCATARSKTLTTAELELIERWLAAHFHCMSDQPYSGRTTKGKSGQFQGQTAMNLDATKYGQTAKALDYSGCLEAIAARKTATLTWLGRPPSEQTDYRDRD